jgi:hypothetical protein
MHSTATGYVCQIWDGFGLQSLEFREAIRYNFSVSSYELATYMVGPTELESVTSTVSR